MKRVLLCAALLAFSGLASATVYKWTDAQGKIQYGDRPPDGVKAELVTLLGNRNPSQVSARPDTARAPRSSSESAPAAAPETRKTVDQDVAAVKAKQCADAQERYRKLIEGRRIYKEGKDGERQYMSSEEIDTARVNAKNDVDSICNSAS